MIVQNKGWTALNTENETLIMTLYIETLLFNFSDLFEESSEIISV